MVQPKVAPKLIYAQKSILTTKPTVTQMCVRAHLSLSVYVCVYVNKKSHRGAYVIFWTAWFPNMLLLNMPIERWMDAKTLMR